MQHINQDDLVIFSVDTLDTTDTTINRIRLNFLVGKKIKLKLLTGYYKGKKEQSYIVSLADFNQYIKPYIFDTFNQECYMILKQSNAYGKRIASLVYKDKTVTLGGYFQLVDRGEAIQQECYTHDYKNDLYYIVK